MGWSGPDNFIWGDEPQDIVDAALRGAVKDPEDIAPAIKYQTEDLMLSNKDLRAKVDAAYLKTWSRKANDDEYRNLIRVALGIGGYTLMEPNQQFPAANPLAKKIKTARKSRKSKGSPSGFRGMR